MALHVEPIATHIALLERSYRDELNAIKDGGILTSKEATHTVRVWRLSLLTSTCNARPTHFPLPINFSPSNYFQSQTWSLKP